MLSHMPSPPCIITGIAFAIARLATMALFSNAKSDTLGCRSRDRVVSCSLRRLLRKSHLADANVYQERTEDGPASLFATLLEFMLTLRRRLEICCAACSSSSKLSSLL